MVSSGLNKKIYSVKDSDGSQKVEHNLSQITNMFQMLSWVTDTDFVLGGAYESGLMIVDFMHETKSTAPISATLPNGHKTTRSCFVWKDKKVLAVSAGTGSRTYIYDILTEMPCSGLCLTCDGIFRTKCLSCKPNSSFSSPQVCGCDAGFYASKQSLTLKIAKPALRCVGLVLVELRLTASPASTLTWRGRAMGVVGAWMESIYLERAA